MATEAIESSHRYEAWIGILDTNPLLTIRDDLNEVIAAMKKLRDEQSQALGRITAKEESHNRELAGLKKLEQAYDGRLKAVEGRERDLGRRERDLAQRESALVEKDHELRVERSQISEELQKLVAESTKHGVEVGILQERRRVQDAVEAEYERKKGELEKEKEVHRLAEAKLDRKAADLLAYQEEQAETKAQQKATGEQQAATAIEQTERV